MRRVTHYGPCPICNGTGRTYSGCGTARDVACYHCLGAKQVVTAVEEEWAPPLDLSPRCGPNTSKTQ